MKYECKNCNYITTDKSNYNKHIDTKVHSIKSVHANKNKIKAPLMELQLPDATSLAPSMEPNDKKFTCKYCNNSFSKSSNLNRHLKICKSKETEIREIELKELKSEVIEIKTQLNKYEHMQKELMDYVKNNPSNHALIPHQSNQNSHNNTIYNISVKNYVQQNYPNAPALIGMTDYARLTHDESGKENKDEFVDTLVYEHKNATLHKYLGDFIVGYYKKDNPSEQSMWTSDTSRLTYIIKELLFNKKSIWNHDYKGIKTKNCIINPLLQHIKKYLDEYWINHLDHFKTTNLKNLNQADAIYRNIYNIKKNVDSGMLSNDIIRYMAPHFYMDKKDIKGQDMVDYFIDSEE